MAAGSSVRVHDRPHGWSGSGRVAPNPQVAAVACRASRAASIAFAPNPSRLGTKLATRLRTLSKLLAKAGLDVDRLVAEATPAAGQLSEGQGGPLVPATGRGAGRAVERAAAAELDRLRRMQSVLLAMPLAAPMTEYKLNSGFGYRRDPFRRRGAVHTGLDFGGPRNAPILRHGPWHRDRGRAAPVPTASWW